MIFAPRARHCSMCSLISILSSLAWSCLSQISPKRRIEASKYGPLVLATLGPSLLSSSLPVTTIPIGGGVNIFTDLNQKFNSVICLSKDIKLSVFSSLSPLFHGDSVFALKFFFSF